MRRLVRYITEQWYIPLSLLLALWFVDGFIRRYPAAEQTASHRQTGVMDEHSILKKLREIRDHRVVFDTDSVYSTVTDPFRATKVKKRIRVRRPKQRALPGRNFKVSGITSDKTAILINNAGHSVIVQVGDTIDSARVISISADKIVLRDQGGRFEIKMNEP